VDAKYFKLSNKVEIPFIGYGTGVVNHYTQNRLLWIKKKAHLVLSLVKHLRLNRQISIGLFVAQMVKEAYDVGFRLFNTGRIYGYSKIKIGKGVDNIPRESSFITTKISDLNLAQFSLPAGCENGIDYSLYVYNF
jgi:diketogulonate reductase-like aldo/keto reductase